MKVAIVGSREYVNIDNVRRFVATLPADAIVVSGGARGVDRTAAEAARARGLTVEEHIPDWNRHGAAAGIIRNTAIVAAAEVLVCFWDGRSAGTNDSIGKARRAGKRVIQVPDAPILEPDAFHVNLPKMPPAAS